MKKLRITRDSALLLACRRVASLEARVSKLEALRTGAAFPGVQEPGRATPASSKAANELARCLWICAVLIVVAVLVTAGLMYWRYGS